MTTQATYNIDGHTMHVRSEGNPEGAALNLASAAMHPHTHVQPPNAGFADYFHRATDAELVRPGTRCTDVAYHYEIQTLGGDLEPRRLHVMAYEQRGRCPGFGPKWECFFAGSLEDFLLRYAHCEEIELAGA